jgi:hypothetical protein
MERANFSNRDKLDFLMVLARPVTARDMISGSQIAENFLIKGGMISVNLERVESAWECTAIEGFRLRMATIADNINWQLVKDPA